VQGTGIGKFTVQLPCTPAAPHTKQMVRLILITSIFN
jgi:hypothetical protein